MQSPLSVWLPFFWGSPALQINIFLKRQCVVNCLDRVCTVTLAAMLLQSPDYSVFLGTPQASPSCLQEKKKKREILLGTKIKVLKLLILNVSMSFVFFWTIFGLLPWRLASLGISGCFFFFFLSPAFASPFLGCSTAVPFQLASAERCEFSCCMSLAWCKHIARDMLKSSRWFEPERDNSKTVRRSMLKIRAGGLIWSISASLNPDSLIYNLKRIHFVHVILLTPFYLTARTHHRLIKGLFKLKIWQEVTDGRVSWGFRGYCLYFVNTRSSDKMRKRFATVLLCRSWMLFLLKLILFVIA